MKVRWTRQAELRLAEIEDYIAERNQVAAERLVSKLISRAETLSKLSHRGRVLPEHPESGCRELIEGNYRIVYLVGPDAVEVVTVFEAHRLPPHEGVAPGKRQRRKPR